ncbi:MAG: transcription elongation factor GreA [Chloroflexi bacterium]|nr:transcription elongation factor GreA [Chloroflexota bacterium]
MAHKDVYLTPEGLAKLQEELEYLRTVRRHEVAEVLQRAKEMGGTVNNAEYEDAKNLQAFVEGRVLTLEGMIQNAVLISSEEAHPPFVTLGSKVTVRPQGGKEQHYIIVGSAEASPGDGKISNESPVGRSLLGRRVGDEIAVMVPAGPVVMTIVAIE